MMPISMATIFVGTNQTNLDAIGRMGSRIIDRAPGGRKKRPKELTQQVEVSLDQIGGMGKSLRGWMSTQVGGKILSQWEENCSTANGTAFWRQRVRIFLK